MSHEVTCYCGAPCRLRSSRWGGFYGCTRPGCDGLVGVHKTTGRPLGTPAPKATRTLRTAVHGRLDPLWRAYAARTGVSPDRARTLAYRWMARQLGLPGPYHTGELDADGCRRALEVLEAAGPDAPFRPDP